MKKSVCTTAMTLALVLVPATFAVPSAVAAPAPSDMSTKLAGKTIFLDPGHQGGGSADQMSRQVDNGRGATKECETTGMTAIGGVPEHTINWKIARLVKTSLEGLGATVVLSRSDDTGWAGCITDRAKAANASGAQIALSIHADDSAPADHGFHVIVPQLPIPDSAINQVQSNAGRAASKAMRDAYVRNGFQPANYAGVVDGIQTRADVAGPALTTIPDVFIEMGNGANADDAKVLTSPHGQLQHAIAITTGLVGYLLGVDLSHKPGHTPTTPARADAATPASPDAAGPAGDQASTPGTGADQSNGGSQPQDQSPQPAQHRGSGLAGTGTKGLGDNLTQLMQPLLQAMGLDVPDGSGTIVSELSNLGTKLLAAALENMKK